MKLSDFVSHHIPPAVFGLADWATSFTLSPNCHFKRHFAYSYEYTRIISFTGVFWWWKRFQDNKNTTNIFILKLQNQRWCTFQRNSDLMSQVLGRGKHSVVVMLNHQQPSTSRIAGDRITAQSDVSSASLLNHLPTPFSSDANTPVHKLGLV